jgi:hypothetical protein
MCFYDGNTVDDYYNLNADDWCDDQFDDDFDND